MKSSRVTSCSWCPRSLQLCFHPWDWGENGSFVLCWDSSASADGFRTLKRSFGSSFTVQQQEQDPDKGWVPPTPAEIPALHSCTKGTRLRRTLTPQQRRRDRRALHTPHVWNSHRVVTLALWSSNLDDKEGIPAYRGALKMLLKASRFILKRSGWVRATTSSPV